MSPAASVSAPEPLTVGHDLSKFDSGEPSLDDWLRRRALANQTSGTSRTYIIHHQSRAAGYYCLASGAIGVIEAPSRLRRNMPNPIPMTVLGRLAIDSMWQGQGLGHGLVRDAVLRTAQAASIIGIRGLMVHALSLAARNFYQSCGFQSLPLQPMLLVIALGDAEAAFSN